MTPRRTAPDLRRTVAEFTPDSRRWRRRVAGLAAAGAPLALYAAFAVVSGVKTGIVYNLLVLLFGLLALLLPAVTAAVLLAPDSGQIRADSSVRGDAVETLKRRYATGEIGRAEFDRRLDGLIGGLDGTRELSDGSSGGHETRETELDATGR